MYVTCRNSVNGQNVCPVNRRDLNQRTKVVGQLHQSCLTALWHNEASLHTCLAHLRDLYDAVASRATRNSYCIDGKRIGILEHNARLCETKRIPRCARDREGNRSRDVHLLTRLCWCRHSVNRFYICILILTGAFVYPWR